MGLLDIFFGRKNAVASVRKNTGDAASQRTMVTVVPPKESPQELLDRIRTRNERHDELNALISIGRSLPPARQPQKMAELQKAVYDAIEADVIVQKYRQAYYLYQSALHAARRS